MTTYEGIILLWKEITKLIKAAKNVKVYETFCSNQLKQDQSANKDSEK